MMALRQHQHLPAHRIRHLNLARRVATSAAGEMAAMGAQTQATGVTAKIIAEAATESGDSARVSNLRRLIIPGMMG